MSDEDLVRLRPLVAAWSDGDGLAQAVALADRYRTLLPRRITNAQLAGLDGVVRASSGVGQVKAFLQNQRDRAGRAGRLEVKEYWDALLQALGSLEEQAGHLASRAGMSVPSTSGKGKARLKVPEWLTLWLAQEFVQHLVAHSLYLGRDSQAAR